MAAQLGWCHFVVAGRRCPDRVYYLRNDSTWKTSPVDAKPAPNGNVRLDLENATYHVLTKDELARARDSGEALHLNHWATCQYAPRKSPRRRQIDAKPG